MHRLPYRQMIDLKRWADRGLYEAISENRTRLTADEMAMMLRILDHIQTVDWIFKAHLRGQTHGFTAARSEVMPSFEMLAAGALEVDGWYADYVRELPESAFEERLSFAFTSGKPANMSRGEIILHVCLHGTYHRGNAGAVLQLKGLTPSRDSVTDYLEAVA